MPVRCGSVALRCRDQPDGRERGNPGPGDRRRPVAEHHADDHRDRGRGHGADRRHDAHPPPSEAAEQRQRPDSHAQTAHRAPRERLGFKGARGRDHRRDSRHGQGDRAGQDGHDREVHPTREHPGHEVTQPVAECGHEAEDRRHRHTLAPTFDRVAAGADASRMHTTMIRTRVLTIAATAAIAVGACGAPATPDLTSPTEIVLATLATTETAKSVHLEATISGEVKMSVLPGAPATPIDLTGTTVSGDVALDAGAVHATFKVPNLFDLAGELIVVDGKGFFKTTATGAQYQVTSLGEAIPSSGKGLADALGDLLMSEDITLTKGGDVGCGGKQCYTVTTQLTAEDLGGVQVNRAPDRHRRRDGRHRGPRRKGASQPSRRPDGHAHPARRRPGRGRRGVLQVGRGGHRDRAAGRPGRQGRVTFFFCPFFAAHLQWGG